MSTAPPLAPPAGNQPGRAGEGHWTERHGKAIIFSILTLITLGVYMSVPVAVFPETNFPRVVVGVDNGVMPIDQMMVTITRPLEEALNTVQGLDYMWSVTSRGSAEIDLFFNWNVDMFRTLTLVNAALAQVQPTLPSTARVTATRLTFAAFPIIGYSLTSDRVPMTRIWEMAYYELKPRINRTTGTANVVVQGGQVPEFDIVPDAAKLVQTGVTIPEVLDAIAHTNMVDSPGLIEWRHQLVLSLVSGQTRNPPEIADIVVKTTPAGLPVHIGDIASVEPGVMPVYTIVTANGRPAVLINVFRQIGGNTVATADAVHAEVARIRKTLPPGVEMKLFYDQSEIVKASIESVRDAILVGLLLASLIMVLFLRDWGTSLVAGMVIPATIAVTVVVLRVLHHSYNLMTLGGMAAAVGLVIDDAIVVVENIVMHRDAGQSRSQAIGSALAEVRKPLIGSTVTPIVVFLPLIAISGVTGVFFRALAVTVGSALVTSLALALTWTPTLSHYLIRERRRNAASLRHANVPDWIMRRYERTLRFTLEHPFLLAAFAAVLVAVSYLCYTHTGSDLLPYMDEGGFIIDYVSPAGTSLDDTNRMLMHVEQILQNTPEVASFSRRTGLQLGLAAVTEANTGDLSVLLKKHHKKPTEEVIKEVREKVLKAEPLLDVEFPQLLSDMIGDLTSEPEPCVIKLFSENEAILREWAPRVADEIKKIPGVVDVFNGIENTISGPAITFNVDPTVAARAGFTAQEVEQDVSAILQGEPATTPVVANDRTLTVRVRFPPDVRSHIETIRNTLLVSASGKTATLGTLANLVEIPGQLEIRRENLQRDVQVTGRFENMSLGTGMAQVKRAVARLHLPTDIRVAYGGQYEEQQTSFHDLLMVFILAVVLVFIVLLFEFTNFASAVAILTSALLSTSGVFLALLLTGATFNLSSFMGLIMVVGIVAKNGILLLDADQKFRAGGANAEESMMLAGERRLRPITMTALATVAGMLPLSLGIGAGSQMLKPLAIAVIGGILASMILSLVVTPAVHYYLNKT